MNKDINIGSACQPPKVFEPRTIQLRSVHNGCITPYDISSAVPFASVFLFVPGLLDTKLKISRAESRNVTEPKVATPRRTARTVHPRAVQPREALRTALVWAKLTLSSPVYLDTICFEVDWRRTTTISAGRFSVEFAAGVLISYRLSMGPPDISEPSCAEHLHGGQRNRSTRSRKESAIFYGAVQ